MIPGRKLLMGSKACISRGDGWKGEGKERGGVGISEESTQNSIQHETSIRFIHEHLFSLDSRMHCTATTHGIFIVTEPPSQSNHFDKKLGWFCIDT